MNLEISFEYEKETGRWLAELAGIPNTHPILVYGDTLEQATFNAKQADLQALLWALEDGEILDIDAVIFSTHTPTAA